MDKQKIEQLREWSQTHFKEKNSIGFYKEVKLINRFKAQNNFDILVIVVGKSELDNNILLYIQDETDKCRLTTTKQFNFIEVNDLIRVRGVYETDEKQLTTYTTSNILVMPKESYVYTDYNFRFYINQKEILYGKVLGKSEEEIVKNNSQLESVLLAKKRNLEQVRTLDSLLSVLNSKEYNKKDYESLLLSNSTVKRILKIEYLPEYSLQKVNSISEMEEVYNSIKGLNSTTNNNSNQTISIKSKSNSKSKDKKQSKKILLY